MKRSLVTCVVALTLASATVIGCDSEDKKNYDVTVTWNVAGAQACSAYLNADTTLEFDNVEINVFEAEGDTEPIQEPIMVPCTDFSYTISRLKRGNYHVELGAYAEDSDGDYLPYFQAKGAIKAPAANEEGYEFGLMLGKGEVLIKWNFTNYEWCGSNGVVDMDISLVDELVPCTDENYLIEDVTPGEYTLTIDGLDDSGDQVAYGEYNEGNPFMVKPGQDIEALVLLDPV